VCQFLDLSGQSPLQGVILDLEEQEAVYNAILKATNRSWINGLLLRVLSRAATSGQIYSIAENQRQVLWFWFGRFVENSL
jgi:hypothetical protein